MLRRNNLICLIVVSVLLSSCNRQIAPGLIASKNSLKSFSAGDLNKQENSAASRQKSIRDPLNEDSNVTYDGQSASSINRRGKDFEDYNSDISSSSHRVIGPDYTEKVVGVSVLSPDLNLKEGEEKTVEASVKFSKGGRDENVRWESSDHSVAKIDSRGTIEAVSGGSATISAYALENFSKKDTITVTVEAKKVKSEE